MKKLALTLIAALLPLGAHAETAAKILGAVHDQDGQPVPSARISVLGQKTSEKRTASATSSGEFTLSELPPDVYQITATCDTCNDASSVVEVGAGQSRSVQLEVNTKSASDVIAVDTHAATLDVSSAVLGMNVSNTEIEELPVNGRAISPLALTAPFVSNAAGANYTDLRFAGQSIAQNNYTLDGIDVSSVVTRAPGFLPVSGYDFRLRTSLDSVDEFRTDSATYSAEDGGVTGAQVKMVSHAATPQWHGSAFEYFRNDRLQARNFFDGENPAELRMNQFGGNAGGEVVKDKVFAFAGYEQLLQRAGVDIFETTPSAEAIASADPGIAPVLATMPAGFARTGDPDVDQAHRNAVASQDESNLNARVDYVPNAKQRLWLRYSRSAGTLVTPDNTTYARDIHAQTEADQSVAHWTDQLTTNLTNSLTFGINRSPTDLFVTAGGGLGSELIGIGTPTQGGIDSPGGLTQLVSGDLGSAASYHGRTYQLTDGLSWVKGAHAISAGVDFRFLRVPFSEQGGAFYHFDVLDSFLANTDADLTYVGDVSEREAAQEQSGFYINDQWRVNPRVELNFGLRYDYFGATREINNRAMILNLANFTEAPASGALYRVSHDGFEPRIGFTWSPASSKGNTVVRAGAGVYNGTNAFLDTLRPIENSVARDFFQGVTYPQNVPTLLASGTPVVMPEAIDTSSFGHQQHTYAFTTSLQQALPGQWVAEAAYLYSFSRHLTQENVANLGYGVNPLTGDLLRSFPGYGATDYLTNGGNSNYSGLNLGLNRHLVDNLTVSVSYNWSHATGDTDGAGDELLPQDPACLRCESADSSFDIRQSVSATAVYALPFGANFRHFNKGLLGRVLGGWTLAGAWNGHTGLPVNVTIQRLDEILYSPSAGQYYSPYADSIPGDAIHVSNVPFGGEDRSTLRPDVVAGVDPYIKSGGTLWLNPAAFSIPLPGEYGNLGRNALRGPGFSQVDLSLARSFKINERSQFEVRAEAFNLFNHANFSNPTALLPDGIIDVAPGTAYSSDLAAGFGQLDSTVGRTVGLGTSRQIQLSARVQF